MLRESDLMTRSTISTANVRPLTYIENKNKFFNRIRHQQPITVDVVVLSGCFVHFSFLSNIYATNIVSLYEVVKSLKSNSEALKNCYYILNTILKAGTTTVF